MFQAIAFCVLWPRCRSSARCRSSKFSADQKWWSKNVVRRFSPGIIGDVGGAAKHPIGARRAHGRLLYRSRGRGEEGRARRLAGSRTQRGDLVGGYQACLALVLGETQGDADGVVRAQRL